MDRSVAVTAALVVVLVVAVSGCGGSGGDDAAAQVVSTVPVDGTGSTAAGAGATVAEPTTAVPSTTASRPTGPVRVRREASLDLGDLVLTDIAAVSPERLIAVGITQVPGTPDSQDVAVATSDDGGRSWRWAARLVEPGDQWVNRVAITPDGAAVLVGYEYEPGARAEGGTDNHHGVVWRFEQGRLGRVPATAGQFGLGTGDVDSVILRPDGSLLAVGGYQPGVAVGNDTSVDDVLALWRSADFGRTWSTAEVPTLPISDVHLCDAVLGPDGALYAAVQTYRGGDTGQFDAGLLRSSDLQTWTAGTGFAADYDQSSSDVGVSSDGRIAVLGWDEVVENGEDRSVVWLSTDGGATFTRLPEPPMAPRPEWAASLTFLPDGRLLVIGTTAPFGETGDPLLLATHDGSTWEPYVLDGSSTPEDERVSVVRGLPDVGLLLAAGTVAPAGGAQRDAVVWTRPLGG